MAAITPETDVILLKVPLEMDEKNQLTFANATDQFNYFYGLNKRTFDKFTYQRKDGTITVPDLVDNLYGYNYVMYRNENFSNKWFYAYIVETKFLSPNSSSIKIKTDPWQTWQFDITRKACFTEREHVNDDTIGANTINESLDCGEYVISSNTEVDIDDGFMVAFMVTNVPYDQAPISYLTQSIGNAFCGMMVFACRMGDANKIIQMYDATGGTTADEIHNIYMIAEGCVDLNHGETWSYDSKTATVFPIFNNTQILNSTTVTESSTLNGYTPKNKKLYTYPYKFFHITNNTGTDVEYKWEDTTIPSSGMPYASISVDGIASCGGQSKLMLTKYKGYDSSGSGAHQLMAYGISGGKLPTCAWKTDYYTNWLTTNAVNLGVNILNKAMNSTVAGSLTGNPGIAAATGGAALFTSALSTIVEKDKASKMPDQSHGDSNVGDLVFSNQGCAFNVYDMSIRAEYARVIDEFFSEFGYKVNRVKIPNITGRLNWNYVKTVGCYIRADIPQEDLIEIQSMFNNGITLWHNPATFGDYSQNNGIV